MTQDSRTLLQGSARSFAWAWGFIAPWMVALAFSHTWAHTVTRYVDGAIPLQFGIYLGHGDIVPAMLILLVLLASAAWLLGGAVFAIYMRLRRRPVHRLLVLQWIILLVALGIPTLPAQAWDRILLTTVGPGNAAGDLLATAARRGDIERLRKLLDSGIAVDSANFAGTTERNALVEASRSHQTKAVALLLERGADPNHRGSYQQPIAYAVLAGEVEIVRLLLKYGADSCISIIRYRGNVRSEVRLETLAKPEVMAVLPACKESDQKQ